MTTTTKKNASVRVTDPSRSRTENIPAVRASRETPGFDRYAYQWALNKGGDEATALRFAHAYGETRDEVVTQIENREATMTDPSRSRTRRTREAPLGIAEIAQLLDVKPGTVAQWRQRHIFPHPELTVGGSPAWWADTIIEWAEATGRR